VPKMSGGEVTGGHSSKNENVFFFSKSSYRVETKVAVAENLWGGVRWSSLLKNMQKKTSAFHSRGLSESK
jgi:hypothetical protein